MSALPADETRPDVLGALGAEIAARVKEHEPEADLLAAPELGAVALAAAASLASGLPFDRLISEEMLNGGYRKKYFRAISRLTALARDAQRLVEHP